jgi:hypothetical protein
LSIDKQFFGDLDAHSADAMLSAGTAVDGSAGYVAIERVGGMLQGRSGSFVLQHNGTMNRGAPELTIAVIDLAPYRSPFVTASSDCML